MEPLFLTPYKVRPASEFLDESLLCNKGKWVSVAIQTKAMLDQSSTLLKCCVYFSILQNETGV